MSFQPVRQLFDFIHDFRADPVTGQDHELVCIGHHGGVLFYFLPQRRRGRRVFTEPLSQRHARAGGHPADKTIT